MRKQLMAMKLMYITNDPCVAEIADRAGVDRIFIDLEIIGKKLRQANRDTVISNHSIADINTVKSALKNAKVLVRTNPIHFASEKELNAVAESNADVVMLPYFTTATEAKAFVNYIGGRKRTCLLFETPESIKNAEEILDVGGIDEVFIGLNDLHMGYNMKFMFELLANGTVDRMCNLFKQRNIPYGFGGIAQLNQGTLKANIILGEHYRLGSDCVILSRSFCNASLAKNMEQVRQTMEEGVKGIREYEEFLKTADDRFFNDNRKNLIEGVKKIVSVL